VTLGRAEFNPGDACCLPTGNNCALWSWGYAFVVPETAGLPIRVLLVARLKQLASLDWQADYTSYNALYLGNWAYQVRLDDAQCRS
jgi:hypothetical protein